MASASSQTTTASHVSNSQNPASAPPNSSHKNHKPQQNDGLEISITDIVQFIRTLGLILKTGTLPPRDPRPILTPIAIRIINPASSSPQLRSFVPMNINHPPSVKT